MNRKSLVLILFCQTFLFACSPTSTPSPTQTPSPPLVFIETLEAPQSVPLVTKTFLPTPTPISIISALGSQAAQIDTTIPQFTVPITKDNLVDLELLAEWGRGWPRSIRFVNDGEQLHVQTAANLFVHDVTDGLENAPVIQQVPGAMLLSDDGKFYATEFDVRRVADNEVAINAQQIGFSIPIKFSPDGGFLAVEFRKALNLLSLTGEIEKTFSRGRDVAFSAEGNIAAIQEISSVLVYDLENDVELYRFSAENPPTFESRSVTSVAISPDGDFVAIGYMPGDYINSTADVLEIYRISDGVMVFSMEHVGRLSYSPPNEFHCDEPSFSPEPPSPSPADKVMFSADGRYLGILFGTAGPPGPWRDRYFEGVHLYIYDTLDWQLVRRLEERVSDAAFTPDSQHLLLAFPDGRIQEWRIADGANTSEISRYSERVEGLALSVDDSKLAVEHPTKVSLYDALNGEVLFQYPARKMAFSPDGKNFALGYVDGKIEVRNTGTGDLASTWFGHEEGVNQLIFLTSGNLVSSSIDCTTYHWQILDGTLMYKFEDYVAEGFIVEETRFQLERLMLLDDGTTLIGKNFDGYVVWDTNDGKIVNFLSDEEFDVQYPQLRGNHHLSPARDYSVRSGSLYPRHYIGALVFLDELFENELYSRPVHFRNISGIDISGDGRLIFTGSIDGTIRIWGIQP